MLLVEEEEAVLEFERDVLIGAGANVVTATRSEDVKTRLLSEPFDAVIMSGKMPADWNAKEAYRWFKQNCPHMENHVLFTFSNGVEQGDERGISARKQRTLSGEALRSSRTDFAGETLAAKGACAAAGGAS